MEGEELVAEASKAISAVFSDKSVSPSETRDSLEELQGEIDLLLDCLLADGVE